jgi:predicted aldo/keto reductase-like oxidoreductase
MKPLEGGMLTNITLALKYLLQFPDVVTIIGIQAVEEIIEVVNIADKPLSITQLDQRNIEKLRKELGNRFCRRCDYCQPCIQEIPISIALHYPSIAKRMPSTQILSGFVSNAMEKAANCDKCGDCEERCPYDLPIREMLEDYVARYQSYKAKSIH